MDDDENEGDAPGECPSHDWWPVALQLEDDGSYTTYRCRWCDGLLVVPPGGMHPNVTD